MTTDLSSRPEETDKILFVLKEITLSTQNFIPSKKYSSGMRISHESEIKTFSDEGKQIVFFSERPT